jgi:hypothetical protein
MNATFVRFVARILVVCSAALPLQASAGLIGTDPALTAAQASAARSSVSAFVSRAEVAKRLQALGVSREAALARVAALTDAEAAQLAARIDEQPAGGFWPLLLVAIFLVWRFNFSDQAKAEEKAPKK